MSAKVKPGAYGGWVAHCRDCAESVSGGMADADLWADAHNYDNHPDEASS
jgi:hypothetical protein